MQQPSKASPPGATPLLRRLTKGYNTTAEEQGYQQKGSVPLTETAGCNDAGSGPPHLAHGALGRKPKLDVQLMSQLHSKLQQADVKELQLAIKWQGMPVDVPSVHSTLKRLHSPLFTTQFSMLPAL